MTKTLTSAALAGVFTLGLTVAAQAQTIPSPANPNPRFPVATNGAPLPSHYVGGDLLTGRSAFAPVGAVIGSGVGAANAVVDGTAGAVGIR